MKSVQNRAPPAKRLVPQVRGNSSPNGQPAGAGSAGSGRSAAAGTPSGIPSTTNSSEGGAGDAGVTACNTASATPSPTRIGRSARSTNDMTSIYGSGGLLGGRSSVYGVSGDRNPGEHFVAVQAASENVGGASLS